MGKVYIDDSQNCRVEQSSLLNDLVLDSSVYEEG